MPPFPDLEVASLAVIHAHVGSDRGDTWNSFHRIVKWVMFPKIADRVPSHEALDFPSNWTYAQQKKC